MFNKKLIFPAIYASTYLLTLYIVLQYFIYSPSQSGMVSAKMDDPSFPYEMWKLFFYPHIVLGTIALLIGTYQLTRRSRLNPNRHRILGRIYGISILLNVLVVPYIALYATGGRGSTLAFLVLDVLWLATTANGIRLIMQKKTVLHRQWMIRSYAVTLVFVSFRLVLGIVELVTDLPLGTAFPLSVVLSIFMNLGFTELYIRRGKRALASIRTEAV
ncbi:DUF2306 domain-containing protein [Cohnella lubricantis]|uniref:DUF2306 domain-containing protein n=1 Tax=Cohnella lubricantis TaxID=2163172 RepID=A0A841T8P2_9BACL|nr:DUF2306 domain-containing protein [Cohnella lubricantis]MBB6677873.1 DUF2306 domain-containing protein [Cohnella lubricantis]MBP2119055.1 uncharacterized membrane protein YozB (DUF420 family) [Cohnella lubricantis]